MATYYVVKNSLAISQQLFRLCKTSGGKIEKKNYKMNDMSYINCSK